MLVMVVVNRNAFVCKGEDRQAMDERPEGVRHLLDSETVESFDLSPSTAALMPSRTAP